MLTFAAPSAPSPAETSAARLVSDPAPAAVQGGLPGVTGGLPNDGLCGPAGAPSSYWPCEMLNAFVLRMAAQGHCVSMSMMLGHHPYALERLSVALAVPDPALRQLALQLQPYFEAPGVGG